MPYPTFQQLPRYQRGLRKREIQREAEGYAVPQLDDIVAQAGKEQAAREEYGAARGQRLGLQKREMGLKKERFGLSQKRFEYSKELTAKREAASREAADRGFALDREMMSLKKEQNKWAAGIGIANIGVETMGAIASVRRAEEEAEQMQLMTTTFVSMLDRLEKLDIENKKLRFQTR